MSNFSFEPLKLKLATNNIIIPMENGVADLTNAETSAKIMLAGKELFPVFDERIALKGDNLINNPSESGNYTGWTSHPDTSIVQEEFMGEVIPVLQIQNTGNGLIYYNSIPVNSSKSYELTMWIKKPDGSRAFHWGELYPRNEATDVPITVVSSLGIPTILTTGVRDFYFFYTGSDTYFENWVKLTAYIVQSDANPSHLKGVGIDRNGILYPGTTKFSMRILNYSNGDTSRRTWIAHPQVREIDYKSVIAPNILQNATLSSYNCSAAIVGDLVKITSHKPDTTRGWVDVTVNYGNLSNTKRLNWSVEGVESYKPTGTLLTMNNRGIKY